MVTAADSKNSELKKILRSPTANSSSLSLPIPSFRSSDRSCQSRTRSHSPRFRCRRSDGHWTQLARQTGCRIGILSINLSANNRTWAVADVGKTKLQEHWRTLGGTSGRWNKIKYFSTIYQIFSGQPDVYWSCVSLSTRPAPGASGWWGRRRWLWAVQTSSCTDPADVTCYSHRH